MTELTQFYEEEWPKILPQRWKKVIASYQKILMASVAAKTKKENKTNKK